MISQALLGEGQRQALARVLQTWNDCVTRSQPRLVIIEGPSGLGKTFIAHHLYAEIARSQEYWPADITYEEGTSARRRVTHPTVVPTTRNTLPSYFWWGIEARQGPSTEGAHVLPEACAQIAAHERYLNRAAMQRSPRLRLAQLFENLSRLVEAAAPFAPVVGSTVGRARDIADLATASAETARHAEALRGAIAPSRHRGGRVTTDEYHADLVESTTGLIQQLARAGLPVLVFVEDAHLSDTNLAAVLRDLIQSFDRSIMVLATSRPTGIDWSEPWGRFVGLAQEQHFQHFSLDPPAEEELVNVVFEHTPRTSPEVASALVRSAGSNPYDLLQLLDLQVIRSSIQEEAITLTASQILFDLPRATAENLARLQWDELPVRLRPWLTAAAVISSFVAGCGPALDQRGRVSTDLLRRSARDCWHVVDDDLASAIARRWLVPSGLFLEFLEPSRYELAWEIGGGQAGVASAAECLAEALHRGLESLVAEVGTGADLVEAVDQQLHETVCYLRAVDTALAPEDELAISVTIAVLSAVSAGDRASDLLSVDLLAQCEERVMLRAQTLSGATALEALAQLHSLLGRYPDAIRCIESAIAVVEPLTSNGEAISSGPDAIRNAFIRLASIAGEEAVILWNAGSIGKAIDRIAHWKESIQGCLGPASKHVLGLENDRLGLLRHKGTVEPKTLVALYGQLLVALESSNEVEETDELFIAARSTTGRLHFDVAADCQSDIEANFWVTGGVMLLSSVVETWGSRDSYVIGMLSAKANLAYYWGIARSMFGLANSQVRDLFPQSVAELVDTPEELIASVYAIESKMYPPSHRELVASRFIQIYLGYLEGHDVIGELEEMRHDLIVALPENEEIRKPVEQLLNKVKEQPR